MAKFLVVGGAGYIGSTTCAWLLDSAHEVWVLDHLSTGHRELVLPGCHFVFGAAGDLERVKKLLNTEKFDGVFHFAAKTLVHESMKDPGAYYENNVEQTQNLLQAMSEAGVKNLVFSSSCAIFGSPDHCPIAEEALKKPLSPYGRTKLEAESLLEKAAKDWGLRVIALRYFNAAGADPQCRTGEWHDQETHLIPNIFNAVIQNKPIEIFGSDYSTPDGTCIRDYVHVWDLAATHGAAMNLLLKKDIGFFAGYNLGSEQGYSVLEVIRSAERIVGKNLKIMYKERREGDPPRLVADSSLARKDLNYEPALSLVEERAPSGIAAQMDVILRSAWNWEKKRRALLRPAIFLDRDGTLNEDPGYLNNAAQLKLLPHVGEALALLKASGYRLAVVSNQSGVARGLIAPDALSAIHARLQELLRPWGVSIDIFHFCLHHPDEKCVCRKPSPKMLFDLAQNMQLDLKRSYMVGDRTSDLDAGIAAGVKAAVLVRTGGGAQTAELPEAARAAYVGNTLLDVARWIVADGRTH